MKKEGFIFIKSFAAVGLVVGFFVFFMYLMNKKSDGQSELIEVEKGANSQVTQVKARDKRLEDNKNKSSSGKSSHPKDQSKAVTVKEKLYSGYSARVRALLLEIDKPLSPEEEAIYKKQVEEANNFSFSDYNVYPVESLKELSKSGDAYASRALVNRVSIEEAEKYAKKSIKAGHLMYSAIALRLILNKETRPKAYAYLLLGKKHGDMISKKSLRVHLNNIPTTEDEFEEAIDYVPTLEQEVSEL